MRSISESEQRAAHLEVARKIALRLLSARPRSAHELRTALKKRNVSEELAHEIVARFEAVGLINDVALAETLVQSRVSHAGRGQARIRQELEAKGIAREVVAQVLSEVDPQQERDAALRLAYRRVASMSSLPPQVARRRLMGVLARRGYPGHLVSSVADEVLGAVEFSTGQE